MTYLVVGLNNPGKKYEQTRHNVGAWFVSAIVKELKKEGTDVSFRTEDDYEYCKVKYRDAEIILILPQTFMNLSGEAVLKAKNFYKISNENIIVIGDDTNLDVGTSRIRFGGSDGGHNGLKSIIDLIGEDFWRLRIGVGTNDIALEDYVLQKPPEKEKKTIDKIIDERSISMLELISENNLRNETNKIN